MVRFIEIFGEAIYLILAIGVLAIATLFLVTALRAIGIDLSSLRTEIATMATVAGILFILYVIFAYVPRVIEREEE